jgi:hypothetical protein
MTNQKSSTAASQPWASMGADPKNEMKKKNSKNNEARKHEDSSSTRNYKHTKNDSSKSENSMSGGAEMKS